MRINWNLPPEQPVEPEEFIESPNPNYQDEMIAYNNKLLQYQRDYREWLRQEYEEINRLLAPSDPK